MDEYDDCICYRTEDKQTTILLKEYGVGETGSLFLTSHTIFFVLGGAIRYTSSIERDKAATIGPDEFVFLPISTYIEWETQRDATVLRFRLNDLIGSIPECRSFRFQRRSDKQPTGVQEVVFPLKINERIRTFVEDVIATERDGVKCANYARHLTAILLTRIQVYYPQDEYVRFFATIANSDVVFSEQVYQKWEGCRTIYQLADAMNMTYVQFTQNFSKVFGQSPGLWLQKRRKEYIYRDVCSSSMPFGEVAIRHGFTPSNLVRYCRTNFGDTPVGLRRSLADRGVRIPRGAVKKSKNIAPGSGAPHAQVGDERETHAQTKSLIVQ